VSLDYGRCIRKLRQAGYNIWGRRLRGGLFRYTLKAHTDPVWLVKARVTLADGRTFVQWVAVNACDEGTARNRAQHKVTKVKILKSKLKE
jgi:hypothetical protein